MTSRILIVDDDPHIRDLLLFAIDKAGLRGEQAADGEEAWERISATPPDLVILDINMPRLNGLDLCRRLRALAGPIASLPVLFLSSRDDEVDRIVGLELGGDDYVTKPFSPREVVARVTAILKRGGARSASPEREGPGPRKARSHGRLSLDPEAWEARYADHMIPLTATELMLLDLLLSAPSKVFTRDTIIDRLHGPGFAITDRTVDSHVRNVRSKFAVAGCRDLIETRPGLGYRLGACA